MSKTDQDLHHQAIPVGSAIYADNIDRQLLLLNDSPTALQVQDNGCFRSATKEEIIKAGINAINEGYAKGEDLTSPKRTQDYLKLRLGGLDYEMLAAIWLNNEHRIIKFETLFRGTVDGASVYPREIVKAGLECNAKACIIAHNHPSGGNTPSSADKQITSRIGGALSLMDIRLLDHIIVGKECASFAEMGLL